MSKTSSIVILVVIGCLLTDSLFAYGLHTGSYEGRKVVTQRSDAVNFTLLIVEEDEVEMLMAGHKREPVSILFFIALPTLSAHDYKVIPQSHLSALDCGAYLTQQQLRL